MTSKAARSKAARPIWWGKVLTCRNENTGKLEYLTCDRANNIKRFITLNAARAFYVVEHCPELSEGQAP